MVQVWFQNQRAKVDIKNNHSKLSSYKIIIIYHYFHYKNQAGTVSFQIFELFKVKKMQKKQADLRYAHQQTLLQSGVVDPSMYPMAPRMEIPVYPTNHQQFFQKPEGFGIIAPDWRSQEQHQQHMHGTIKN